MEPNYENPGVEDLDETQMGIVSIFFNQWHELLYASKSWTIYLSLKLFGSDYIVDWHICFISVRNLYLKCTMLRKDNNQWTHRFQPSTHTHWWRLPALFKRGSSPKRSARLGLRPISSMLRAETTASLSERSETVLIARNFLPCPKECA